FAYDLYGNVVNKTAKVLDYNASSYGIAYEYDHGGNVVRMTYIPASLVLQNETVTGVISYSAVDSITAGPSYTVASGASAVLQAGKKIRLVPGFTAQQGSFFNAKIDPALTQDATVVTYTYDALGRLISVGTPSDADYYASYTYHADSRLFKEILANGTETRDHFYNSPGWLLRIDGDRFTEDITHTTGWSGVAGYYDGRIKTTSFVYNWAGKPVDYAVQYTYDNVGQLTSADNNLNNAWDIGIGNTISYNANGSFLDLTRGSTTKTYAYYTGTNKVQNTDGAGNDYGYDPNANVTRSDPKTIPTITYDSFTHRPTSVSMSSGASLTLEYGGDTQRVLKNFTSSGSTNSKLYLHGQNHYPLLEKNKTTAASETLAVYIYGLNGAVAKRVGTTVLFLLKDHLGSTRVVMDATGLVRTYYDYDALGNLIRTGTTNEVKYQFTGQEIDESSLHNYRARLYDSDLGKFYAVDPAGGAISPYLYVGNDPISFVDPSGRVAVIPAIMSAIKIYSTVRAAYSIYQASQYGFGYGFSAFVQSGISLGVGAVAGGIGSDVAGLTGSQVASVAVSSSINSFGQYALSGGKSGFETSIGLGSVNWSKRNFSLANPFDGGGIVEGVGDILGWSAALVDYYKLDYYLWTSRQQREAYEGVIENYDLRKGTPLLDKKGALVDSPLPRHPYFVWYKPWTWVQAIAEFGTSRSGDHDDVNIRYPGGLHYARDYNQQGVLEGRYHWDYIDGTRYFGLAFVAHFAFESAPQNFRVWGNFLKSYGPYFVQLYRHQYLFHAYR
ncbi:MAG: RHS repeat-associated core domain-containing protein, partial [Anaerolineae bacterium]|nr:RHS repeat-associated core domain-containing protein [Anaerolineae bacterium]